MGESTHKLAGFVALLHSIIIEQGSLPCSQHRHRERWWILII